MPSIRALAIGLIGVPVAASSTLRTMGEGIWPRCATVTTDREPAVVIFVMAPSTESVVQSQEYQNQLRSRPSASFMNSA